MPASWVVGKGKAKILPLSRKSFHLQPNFISEGKKYYAEKGKGRKREAAAINENVPRDYYKTGVSIQELCSKIDSVTNIIVIWQVIHEVNLSFLMPSVVFVQTSQQGPLTKTITG